MQLGKDLQRSEGMVIGSKRSGSAVEVETVVEREGIGDIHMARNGHTAGIDRGIGLATDRGIGQTTGIRIEGSRREAMTGEEMMRGCLDDIENEASRQAHTDGGDTPETGIATTEDESADRIENDPVASLSGGEHMACEHEVWDLPFTSYLWSLPNCKKATPMALTNPDL